MRTELERFLCTLTSLTYLSLSFDSAIQPETWVQMERLVRSLPCPTQLAVLNISVRYDGPPEPLKLEGLEALDVALPPELFKGLQTVMLHVHYLKEQAGPEEGSALTEPILTVIKNKLPKLYDRDIIAVFVDGIDVSDLTGMQRILTNQCSSSPWTPHLYSTSSLEPMPTPRCPEAADPVLSTRLSFRTCIRHNVLPACLNSLLRN